MYPAKLGRLSRQTSCDISALLLTTAASSVELLNPVTFRMSEEEPLLSTDSTSDSSINVQLHPLVLLTLSDHITRQKLQGHDERIIGAIIGEQRGREVSMEAAFICKTVSDPPNGDLLLDEDFFQARLEQCKFRTKM